MIPRIVATPIAPLVLPGRRVTPRPVAPDVVAAALPGPGREKLAAGDILAVTTGQQPGLFTGPLYTIYKALSAIALARRLEAKWGVSVVPVFWVAGDDHDFAEANHAWFLDAQGDPAEIRLRERPAEAPLLPLTRERCGEEIRAALERLRVGTPETEFKGAVLAWLETAYRPEATLADAFADALQALLGDRGLVVLRAHDRSAKRAAAPHVLQGLSVTLPDGYTPVLVEAGMGRDRLRAEGDGFITGVARSGSRGLCSNESRGTSPSASPPTCCCGRWSRRRSCRRWPMPAGRPSSSTSLLPRRCTRWWTTGSSLRRRCPAGRGSWWRVGWTN